jgi:hypothetical protein
MLVAVLVIAASFNLSVSPANASGKAEVLGKLFENINLSLDVNKFVDQVRSVPIEIANPTTVRQCKDSCQNLVTNYLDRLASKGDSLMSGSACVHECYWNTDYWKELANNKR